ncbi:hypothetical protein FNF28_01654 [Cafeteria roenbergensis]|uniref:Leucine-rich repeat-containing N-terminal plant-type domain-containing protein n=1 Tax=Cafeteria roenbergensis TaxID=33653 RepID=A0A5A8DX21_CAFRO|nr:hypothetical protein FNF28_01654 [Cafeteria roenbergensis]
MLRALALAAACLGAAHVAAEPSANARGSDSLARPTALAAEHDRVCNARFPLNEAVYNELRASPECWSDRDSSPLDCAMPAPIEAVHAEAVASNISSLWSTILPMYVAGFVDAMGMDASQLDSMVASRGSSPDRVQAALRAIGTLAEFVKHSPMLKPVLGNYELRHSAILYHARHAVVSPQQLAAAPPVHHDDLAAWRDLHDAMGGSQWHKCARLRDDPCRCAYVFCSPRRMPGGGAALADPAAEAALAEDEDADDAEADDAGLAWRAEAAAGTGSSRDGSRWTLRVTLLTLVEEPMLVGALPASLARMEGLRGLVLTNMGDVVSNACSRRFATTVLGRLRLRYLGADFHLTGLAAAAKARSAQLPLLRWLRSMSVELGGVSSTSDSGSEWSFSRERTRQAASAMVELALAEAGSAPQAPPVGGQVHASTVGHDFYGEDAEWAIDEDEDEDEDNDEDNDEDAGGEGGHGGNAGSAARRRHRDARSPLEHMADNEGAAAAGGSAGDEAGAIGSHEAAEMRAHLDADGLDEGPSTLADMAQVVVELSAQQLADAARGLGMGSGDALLMAFRAEPQTDSAGRAMTDADLRHDAALTDMEQRRKWLATRQADSDAGLPRPRLENSEAESVTPAELLDSAHIIASAAVEAARRPGSEDEKAGPWRVLSALMDGAGAATDGVAAPWFAGAWRWTPGKAVPAPMAFVVRATVARALHENMTAGQARRAASIALEGLTLARTQTDVSTSADHVCAPQAIAPADPVAAARDAAEVAEASAAAASGGGWDAPGAAIGVESLSPSAEQRAREEAGLSLARDQLAAYQHRVPGGQPPRAVAWVCALGQLRRLGVTGSVTGLPSCLGRRLGHLVELDVRGCRFGFDPLVRHPLPPALRQLNATLRSFIGFQQGSRMCPPPGSMWHPSGGAVALTAAMAAASGEDPPEWCARPDWRSWRVTREGGGSGSSAERSLAGTGVFAASAPGYDPTRMRCRPLFEALSDFKGEPAWQCVALPQEGPQQVDPQTAVSEGWAIRFDVTEGPDAAPWWWWSRLEKFWIDGNFAYGRLPERMGELWPNMRTLDLYSNSLEGGIPASFGLMRKLHQVQLQHNRLSGRIPEKLFHPDTLPVLSVLRLQLNPDLEGCIHSEAYAGEKLPMLDTQLVGTKVLREGCGAGAVRRSRAAASKR